MKLFLTSTGLEDKEVAHCFKMSFLSRELKNLHCLVVSIQDSEKDAFYLQKTLREIKNSGIQNIDVFKLGDKQFINEKDYNIIFVCGGNTFDYLDRIRKTGLDKVIINFIKKEESVYVGVSAGSILAGPDITIAGNQDFNSSGLTDFKGLCLTDFVIFPHYEKRLKSRIDELKKNSKYQIIELQNDQAVIINYSNTGNSKVFLDMKYVNK